MASAKNTDPARRSRLKGDLTGTHVRLRPPLPGETTLLFQWLNTPELTAPWDRFSLDSYASFEKNLHSSSEDDGSLYPRFVIAKIEDDRPIGVVGFYRAHPVFEGYDLWYALCDVSERRKGYGKEAVGLTLDFLFAHTRSERVGATSDVENESSYRLLESLGFRREGTLRRALFHHGDWHDVFVYGVTRGEWIKK
ncbi:MAG: GNAT family N-acetyltransferase [Candidatus Thermoplasmatota archaeon]|jgi:RimJ/RimL family protein N-acetyltransferase|nr:GNAT family N-acetyltransferase [Candidatus Thermoplasmatota archaeon]